MFGLADLSLDLNKLPIEFLYQTDFALWVYVGRGLRELYAEYAGSKYPKNVDNHVEGAGSDSPSDSV
jgi:hypothetical protein